jgi:TetR/AcrR family transcriptional repressor of nem operon
MAGRPRSFDVDRVLECAMHAFWRNGYGATGIAELEEVTGLGRQSLYGAFGDKEQLFARALDLYFERHLLGGLNQLLDGAGTARDGLNRVFAAWEALVAQEDFHGCLLCKSLLELTETTTPRGEQLQHMVRRLERVFVQALRRGVGDGSLREDLPIRSSARLLVVSMQGLSLLCTARREPAFVRDVITGLRRALD